MIIELLLQEKPNPGVGTILILAIGSGALLLGIAFVFTRNKKK